MVWGWGESLADPAEQFLAGEGFAEVGFFFGGSLGADVAAGGEDGDIWGEAAEAFGEFAAAHAGHDKVGYDEVDGGIGGLEEVEGPLAVIGGENLIAEGREDRLAHIEEHFLVIDDEDGFVTAEVIDFSGLVADDFLLGGEEEADEGALLGFAGEGDDAAVVSDDTVDPSEAEAAVFGVIFGGEEWFEDADLVFAVDPAAVVGDFDADVVTGGEPEVGGGDGLVKAMV